MSRHESPAKDIRIMVMGQTGVGKSTFICAAAGDQGSYKPSISNDIAPPPKGVEEFEVKKNSRAVVLIEAPGFNHAQRYDLQQVDVIIAWLKKMSETKPRAEINGIIYLYDVNNKFKESGHLMNANRVPDPPGVIFVTCNNVNSSSDAKKVRDGLKDKFPMFNGAEDHFDGTADSAWKFIERIVSSDTSVSLKTFQDRLERIMVLQKRAKLRGRGLWGFLSSIFS